MARRHLLRVNDIERASNDSCDVKRRESGWNIRVGKRFQQVKTAVVHFDCAGVEIGCIENIGASRDTQGQTLVNCAPAACIIDGNCRRRSTAPAGYCAVLGIEWEAGCRNRQPKSLSTPL